MRKYWRTVQGTEDMAKADTELADFADADIDAIFTRAEAASNFLKAFSHEGRLLILCHLVKGERTVTELEELLSSRQAAVSQQLSRLRLEGIVKFRREGKSMYYSIDDPKAGALIKLLYEEFCK
jgi:ArsR family transcriptional regulator